MELDVRFRRFAWGVLAYTVAVVLFGAFLRATGAGAGCGDHWPLCNGEVIPRSPGFETIVEFTHRVTSGIALPLTFVLGVWAFRVTRAPGSPNRRAVRRAAVASVVFMVLEAAIGAGLVLLEYVAFNPSIARAVWMAAHLVNTLLLLAALALTAWWAEGGGVPMRGHGRRAWAVGAALGSVLVLSTSGAVTALGDTLVLAGGIDPLENPVVATLVGLRIYHPILAFVAMAFVGWAVLAAREAGPRVVQAGMAVLGFFLIQMVIGAVNVALLAPVWLQVVHLLVTDLIWIGLVLFSAEALAAPAGVDLAAVAHLDAAPPRARPDDDEPGGELRPAPVHAD